MPLEFFDAVLVPISDDNRRRLSLAVSLLHRFHIATRTEGPAGTREDDTADIVILVDAGTVFFEIGILVRPREGVHGVRLIHCQSHDMAGFSVS